MEPLGLGFPPLGSSEAHVGGEHSQSHSQGAMRQKHGPGKGQAGSALQTPAFTKVVLSFGHPAGGVGVGTFSSSQAGGLSFCCCSQVPCPDRGPGGLHMPSPRPPDGALSPTPTTSVSDPPLTPTSCLDQPPTGEPAWPLPQQSWPPAGQTGQTRLKPHKPCQ